MTGVAWIFFDMGSTLIDESLSYPVWFQRAAALTGGALTGEDVERGYRASIAEGEPTIAGLLRPYGFTGTSAGHLYPAELDRPYPEAATVLQALAPRYKLGIIANQGPGAEDRLERYGLRRWLSIVVASAEAGVAKPDQRIFTLALDKAGCDPGQAVMVGDRLDNDIYPAKQLGMKTIRVRQGYAADQTPRSAAHVPDATVDRLADVVSLTSGRRHAG